MRATSVHDAIERLGQDEDSKLLCGGHSLVPLMKFRLANPSLLIDIRGLDELGGIHDEGGSLRIGAAVRHRDLERHPDVARMAPLLARAAAAIGDAQIRARGTIGGSVVHGDPAGDLLAALLAMEATLTIAGPGGTREVAVADFFVDFWQTAIEQDGVLVSISVPSHEGRPMSFSKFQQRSQDWALVGVAAVGGDTTRVALVNMGPTPLRAHAVEDALAGCATPAEAARLADVGTEPPEDAHADATYRRHLARLFTARALDELG